MFGNNLVRTCCIALVIAIVDVAVVWAVPPERIFVTNEHDDSVSVIDGSTNAVVATANVTSGAGLANFVAASSGIDILCVQEHKVAAGDIAQLSASLIRKGWKSSWTAAVPTAKIGISAGACVVARKHLDFVEVTVPSAHPGRIAGAMVACGGLSHLFFYSMCP